MKPPEPAGGDPPPPRRDASLDDLQSRIDKARGTSRAEARTRSGSAPPRGLAVALRLSSELIAGVIVGGVLGYVLDRTLGSSPFGLIVFVLVGFAAGTTNLIRAASKPAEKPDPGRDGTG